jgi:hypothetical protein
MCFLNFFLRLQDHVFPYSGGACTLIRKILLSEDKGGVSGSIKGVCYPDDATIQQNFGDFFKPHCCLHCKVIAYFQRGFLRLMQDFDLMLMGDDLVCALKLLCEVAGGGLVDEEDVHDFLACGHGGVL